METFVDKYGSTRKGQRVICPVCSTTFIARIDQPQKYCSKACKHRQQENKVKLTCQNCGKIFPRMVSKRRSEFVFCNRKCKDEAQRIGGVSGIMPPHYSTGNIHTLTYRNIYRRLHQIEKLVCKRCGYCEFECGIDIHHIDGNRKNNMGDNLVPLCSPCHRALHFKLWEFAALA